MLIYLDYNATTPMAPEVKDEIINSMDNNWGNPSSIYEKGVQAYKAIQEARCQVATMMGALSYEVIFTSGGTESNNLVIHTAVEHFKKCSNIASNSSSKLPHIITTNIEHDAIKLPLEQLKSRGEIDVTILPVSPVTGQIAASDLLPALRCNTCLVTIMLANNETGVVQPVGEICKTVRKWAKQNNGQLQGEILLHTDAAQAIGKISVDVKELGVDYLTIVGHKFYGPRNGALYVRNLGTSCHLYPQLFGGGQERSYRPGTENTPMIAGLGKACELVTNNLSLYNAHFRDTQNYLEEKLKDIFGKEIIFNSHFGNSEILPNTVNVSFVGKELKGYKILSKCRKLMASVGAACHSQGGPSKILLAFGITEETASNALRLSIGRETSKADIDEVVIDLKQAVNLLQLEEKQLK